MGYRLERRGGVDYVSLIKKADDYDFFVYRPKHKSAAELKTALSGLFGATVGGDGDRLIFKTSVVEIEKIKSLLKRFDVRPREVVVRGKIFEVTPEVLDGVINLSVRQELSNFAETTSGVNNSPPLVKREIKTNISATNAELIVLGGLIENKDTASTAGLSFLPAFMSAKSNSNDKTEIVLSLYIELLPD